MLNMCAKVSYHINYSVRPNNVDLKVNLFKDVIFILQPVNCLHKYLDALSFL